MSHFNQNFAHHYYLSAEKQYFKVEHSAFSTSLDSKIGKTYDIVVDSNNF